MAAPDRLDPEVRGVLELARQLARAANGALHPAPLAVLAALR